MIEYLRRYRSKLFFPALLSSALGLFVSKSEAATILYNQDSENLYPDCINQKIHFAEFSELSKNSVEKFLQEKLSLLEGNLVFKPTDFVGRGFESEILSREVLEVFYGVAQHHHQGQMRKSQVPTSYVVHVLGVAAILVNRLEVKDPQAILAAILHDVIEDSIEYCVDKDELESGVDLIKIRKEREPSIKVTRKMQEAKAQQVKNNIQEKLLEKGLTQEQIRQIDLEKIFRYVLAMTKQDGMDLLDDYYAGLISAGVGAVAIKMADRMYNVGDLKYVANDQFAQGYIFGRPHDPGTVIEFIEFKHNDSVNSGSFIGCLPSSSQKQFKITILQAILESYRSGRITQFSDIGGAIAEVKRIDASIDFTDKEFNGPESVFEHALHELG